MILFDHDLTDEEDLEGDLRENCVSLAGNTLKEVDLFTSLSNYCNECKFYSSISDQVFVIFFLKKIGSMGASVATGYASRYHFDFCI